MKKALFVFCIMYVGVALHGQNLSNTIFSKNDKIHIESAGEHGYFYMHEMQKGQSLYALSKIFHIPLNQLYRINRIKDSNSISLGQQIKVPLLHDYLFKGTSLNGLKYGHYIPVYYQTKPKDNLFRISRIYFDQPIEDLMSRNQLKSNNLSLGQELLIGWLPIASATPREQKDEFEEDLTAPEYPQKNNDAEDISNNDSTLTAIDEFEIESLDEIPEGFNQSLLGALPYSEDMVVINKSEVANWDKTIPDNGTVYVLHKEAVIDSYVELYNPNIKRTVRAKVIGRIPYGAYTSNVNLVLSPRTAKELGALDTRFKVEVKALVYKKK